MSKGQSQTLSILDLKKSPEQIFQNHGLEEIHGTKQELHQIESMNI